MIITTILQIILIFLVVPKKVAGATDCLGGKKMTVFQIDSVPKVVDSSANVLIRVLESSRWDHRLRLDEIYLAVPFLILSGDF